MAPTQQKLHIHACDRAGSMGSGLWKIEIEKSNYADLECAKLLVQEQILHCLNHKSFFSKSSVYTFLLKSIETFIEALKIAMVLQSKYC